MGGFELWPLVLADGAEVEVADALDGQPARGAARRRRRHGAAGSRRPAVERHRALARKVNAGFLRVVGRSRVRLRVYERDAGETLACGTGACAAVVAGVRLGLLDPAVEVETRRAPAHRVGRQRRDTVLMTSPAGASSKAASNSDAASERAQRPRDTHHREADIP